MRIILAGIVVLGFSTIIVDEVRAGHMGLVAALTAVEGWIVFMLGYYHSQSEGNQ